MTDTAVAEAIGVSRQTVWRWKREPAVEAEINARRQELWNASVDRLRSLVPLAIEALEAELRGPQRFRAAETVLKMTGFFSKRGGVEFRPFGPVSAEAIEQQRTDQAELNELLKLGLKPL